MADGINKQIILGNLGNQPEFGATGTNRPFCKFSVATSESWKDKQTGVKEERTEWHTVIAFDKLAEICNTYLKKGSKVYIEGSTKTSSWLDANTQEKRFRKDVVARDMRMLDAPTESGVNPQNPQQQPQQQAPRQHPQAAPAQQAVNSRQNPNGTQQSPYGTAQHPTLHTPPPAPTGGFDDDIPF